RWAEKGRMPPTPLSRLEKVSIKETTRTRRAISAKDLDKVFAAARKGTKVLRMTGEQRYWVYRLATESGLRAAELGSLTPADFNADTVTVRASISKNGQLVNQPLRREFMAELKRW